MSALPLGLQHLSFQHCENVGDGAALTRLQDLRTLWIEGHSCFKQDSLQAVVMFCTRLRQLSLPSQTLMPYRPMTCITHVHQLNIQLVEEHSSHSHLRYDHRFLDDLDHV